MLLCVSRVATQELSLFFLKIRQISRLVLSSPSHSVAVADQVAPLGDIAGRTRDDQKAPNEWCKQPRHITWHCNYITQRAYRCRHRSAAP
ncbi:hypothetical protein PR202_gb17648 [Eleusine coracana subsp. coracana]|uniref:Secreted protein n=1 Tax=Eleusine coracana subsp. coracana TaxID=191504 RepID=A0AAV5F441_ELECO|nr:hypothetical protein PR202_gb17648 [Eleusine coracana subsp. coracana]